MLNLKIKEAARLMGKSEQFVRIGLQRKLLPFGEAFAVRSHGCGSKYSYHIPGGRFAEYMRIPIDELLAEVADLREARKEQE